MPKSLLSILFTLVLLTSSASLGLGQDVVEITNSDILTMVKAKLPAELIIAKIKSSRCHFDTYPSVLSELKYRGVSDLILMAMVEAPVGIRATAIDDRSAAKSVPGAVATGSLTSETSTRATNIGGLILTDRSESPYNARFFVAPMEEGFDGLISALMIEKKLPLRVVADENLADFIVVGNTNKGVHKWYDTVFGSGYERDRNQGSLRVIRVRDRTVIWGAQKGDRSFWFGALKKGGKRKVAERLVNKLKGDLFKDNF